MLKFKETLKNYAGSAAESARMKDMIARLSSERREIIQRCGDPNDKGLVTLLSGINARLDLAAARLDRERAQLEKIEPELIREFERESQLLTKKVGAYREQAIEHMIDVLLPWWGDEGDAHARRRIRRGIEDLSPPSLAKLRKMLPSHTLFQAENGTLLRQTTSFAAHADRVNAMIDS